MNKEAFSAAAPIIGADIPFSSAHSSLSAMLIHFQTPSPTPDVFGGLVLTLYNPLTPSLVNVCLKQSNGPVKDNGRSVGCD